MRNEWPLFQHVDMELGLVFLPATIERIDPSVPDELPIHIDWHPYKGMFWGLKGEWAFLE